MMKKNNKKNRTAQKRKGAAMKRRWGRGAAYVLSFALAFLATYLLSSCADHDDMFDSGIRVGNILLSDNTMVAPGSYDAGSMHAVGVVFYAKGDTAIAVAPVELGDHCFSDSLMSVSGISKDAFTINGLTSTAALMVSGIDTPAARACVEYRSPLAGWYLPSAGELRVLARNLAAVSASMAVIGGEPIHDVQYMSSSEDNSSSSNAELYCYCVSLLRGYAVSVPKKEAHRVRPVILVH